MRCAAPTSAKASLPAIRAVASGGSGGYSEMRKLVPSGNGSRKNLYDENGLLIDAGGLDLCDCLVDDCPGCHFPCPKCESCKCGQECRQMRRWQYDVVEPDGDPVANREKGLVRENKHLVKSNA